MNLSIGLSLGSKSVGAVIEPASLYTTADMVKELDTANSDLIDTDSFRICRTATAGQLLISGVPSGNYRITGTLSAYDGAVGGITSLRFNIVDNSTSRFNTTTAGALDQTVSITSGILRFNSVSTGFGFRLDEFFVEAL